MNDKELELLNDVKEGCGCYFVGDWCYDREGNRTHHINQECNV